MTRARTLLLMAALLVVAACTTPTPQTGQAKPAEPVHGGY